MIVVTVLYLCCNRFSMVIALLAELQGNPSIFSQVFVRYVDSTRIINL
jgi:hypothetical protein